MREFEGVRILETADDLLAFIKEDPLDRLLDYRNDHFLCVLATHPDAEVGEADWFTAVGTMG